MGVQNRRTVETIDAIDRDALDATEYRIKKENCPPPTEWPFDIRRTYVLYYPTGELRAYREKQEYDCIQVREYRDAYLIQLDHYHPHYHPVKHFQYDIPRGKQVALTAGAAMSSYALRARGLSLLARQLPALGEQ